MPAESMALRGPCWRRSASSLSALSYRSLANFLSVGSTSSLLSIGGAQPHLRAPQRSPKGGRR